MNDECSNIMIIEKYEPWIYDIFVDYSMISKITG